MVNSSDNVQYACILTVLIKPPEPHKTSSSSTNTNSTSNSTGSNRGYTERLSLYMPSDKIVLFQWSALHTPTSFVVVVVVFSQLTV